MMLHFLEKISRQSARIQEGWFIHLKIENSFSGQRAMGYC